MMPAQPEQTISTSAKNGTIGEPESVTNWAKIEVRNSHVRNMDIKVVGIITSATTATSESCRDSIGPNTRN